MVAAFVSKKYLCKSRQKDNANLLNPSFSIALELLTSVMCTTTVSTTINHCHHQPELPFPVVSITGTCAYAAVSIF